MPFVKRHANEPAAKTVKDGPWYVTERETGKEQDERCLTFRHFLALLWGRRKLAGPKFALHGNRIVTDKGARKTKRLKGT